MRTRPPSSMPAPPAFRLSAETCRLARWPRATRGTRSRRQKASACRFCLLVVGRFGPRRAKRKAMRNGRNASLGFSTHHPKSAKRARVLLNTPQSTGFVPHTLHKSGSLLREDQDRAEQSVCLSCGTNANPSFSSLRKPAALFSGRFRAACSGPLWLRLRRASRWSLRSKECSHNL